MSKEKDIEKLFKEKFQNFEAPVDPALWSNVQAGIGSGASTAVGGISLVKAIVIGAVAAGLIAGGIFVATNNHESPPNENKAAEELVVKDDTQKETSLDKKQQVSAPITGENENQTFPSDDKGTQEYLDDDGEQAKEQNTPDKDDSTQGMSVDGSSSKKTPDADNKTGTTPTSAKEEQTKETSSSPKLKSKLIGSDMAGEAPLRAHFIMEANTEDITWNVKNSQGELINMIVGKDFDMNFTESGKYLVQVNTSLGEESHNEEILIEVTRQTAEHMEKFGFEMDKSVLDLKGEAIVLDMNNPNRAALKFNLTIDQIEVFKLSIYDGNTRKLVYETTNINEREWSGRDMSGSPVTGTYYFMEAVAGNGDNQLEIIRKRVDIISNR